MPFEHVQLEHLELTAAGKGLGTCLAPHRRRKETMIAGTIRIAGEVTLLVFAWLNAHWSVAAILTGLIVRNFLRECVSGRQARSLDVVMEGLVAAAKKRRTWHCPEHGCVALADTGNAHKVTDWHLCETCNCWWHGQVKKPGEDPQDHPVHQVEPGPLVRGHDQFTAAEVRRGARRPE